ncbi:nucleotidyltransferase [Nitrosospira lacus]|uniref:Nucleotidyltransferase n=1 Tax=Nitrosospira lacus TaxID=1288494 RepID=A0A1W6SKY0_9PROT|nr:nucleotidyltransferase [Nitrosospira lacus]
MLSAGRGRRLLSLTENVPKCLLSISGKTVIEWQIDALLAAGIDEVTVVTGFKSTLVEYLLQQRYANCVRVNTVFNPFFDVADNLASCWLARSEMDREFLLLNGDTVFDQAVLKRVLNSDPAPITLSVSYKSTYDADDMKVQLDEKGWVKHINKNLRPDQIDCESIGLVFFREHGPQLFRNAIEEALRQPAKLQSWYLAVIDALADKQLVSKCAVPGHLWCEIDFPMDLARAEALLSKIDQNQITENPVIGVAPEFGT